jgi:hypothetical protein
MEIANDIFNKGLRPTPLDQQPQTVVAAVDPHEQMVLEGMGGQP